MKLTVQQEEALSRIVDRVTGDSAPGLAALRWFSTQLAGRLTAEKKVWLYVLIENICRADALREEERWEWFTL